MALADPTPCVPPPLVPRYMLRLHKGSDHTFLFALPDKEGAHQLPQELPRPFFLVEFHPLGRTQMLLSVPLAQQLVLTVPLEQLTRDHVVHLARSLLRDPRDASKDADADAWWRALDQFIAHHLPLDVGRHVAEFKGKKASEWIRALVACDAGEYSGGQGNPIEQVLTRHTCQMRNSADSMCTCHALPLHAVSNEARSYVGGKMSKLFSNLHLGAQRFSEIKAGKVNLVPRMEGGANTIPILIHHTSC